MTVASVIRSLRVRATPLVLSGVLTGISSARMGGDVEWSAAVFFTLTAVFLQFVSNLSNELGDSLHGTDRADREGMRYSLQSGELTEKDIKRLIAGCIALSCAFGLMMIRCAFGTLFCLKSAVFIALGALAVIAAMRYTLGKNPYGYRGLGDIYVFLFFGLATVCGGCYLCSGGERILDAVLPACAIGCFSVGVLNVNNIRDMKADAATRVTMAIRLGEKGARVYQTVLIALGWICLLCESALDGGTVWSYAYVLSAPLFAKHLATVWTKSGSGLDKMVPMLSISTFILSILRLIG